MRVATRAAAGPPRRSRVTVRGVVQGVGFRPYVHALATGLGLAGHVTNTPDGVVAEVEGGAEAVAAFCARIGPGAPPLAWVESVDHQTLAVTGGSGFAIVASRTEGQVRTLVPPDTATCADCLAELADPGDRRHRHPFISCTNCGPRLTIVTGLPYDRAHTTMAGFPMCGACAGEYADPADRRFHAQPIACHACGPRLRLLVPDGARPDGARVDGDRPEGSRVDSARPDGARPGGTYSGRTAPGGDPIGAARALLAAGGVVAVKGLGGYHLACDADNADAVALLRRRKARGDKPFAVMVRDLPAVERLARTCPQERALLTGPVRPVVLLRGRRRALGGAVAPGAPDIGVMLPYTPVHHLLLGLPGDPPGPSVLVMTSGNVSGEPIVTDDGEALEKLAPLADALLVHDRPIRVPCDDSVVRVLDGSVSMVRRSRGYAPLPVALPVEVRPALAVGGDLKNTFCLGEGRRGWLSAHIGDMDAPAAAAAFERAREQLSAVTAVRPEVLAADRHPRYRSAAWAQRDRGELPLVRVQHHHAHLAAAMAEHGLDGTRRVVGVAFDGTGYGDDGAVWGGEFLLGDYAGFTRFCRLAYVPLPGGDAAVRRPYRMALAHLWAAGIAWDPGLGPVAACPPDELRVLARQVERGLNCAPTSSMGRLFDAVSSLAGVCHLAGYEAQAAVELEAAALDAGGGTGPGYAFGLAPGADGDAELVAAPGPVLASVIADLRAGTGVRTVAARFHAAVADLVLRGCTAARERHGLETVALTGGVFGNALLSRLCADALRAAGFTVLVHRLVPPNDGGLALGQLMVAARRSDSG
ncbi:carbamoyltransferase HypF [Actinacidiphila paucisporea]|uniref:Carbamoyltransferase n=1 Tax=Actinacidiphila paucisporea TaxID=310782 RepID=A0A1M7PLW1_9ACTN|nr:carbamoyltransferase HypF [Actinacidiphila paucisporea]SHN18036.1 hydrogenase maturation protein HypF [Actinacidiphila paucisporea]